MLALCALAACAPESGPEGAGPDPGVSAPAAVVRPLHFSDMTESSGLGAFRQVAGDPAKSTILDTIGGGVACLDYDDDGDMDVYLTNAMESESAPDSDGAPRDALFANLGGWRFEDRTQAARLGDRGWTCGVSAADVDGDGAVDLYLTAYGPNSYLRNRGDGTFEDATERSGLGDPGWGTGACFFDFDRDGDLDLYVANYVEFDRAQVLALQTSTYRGVQVFYGPRGLPAARDSFYRNDGTGRFEDATVEVGIAAAKSYGFQALPLDSDLDGWLDVYVANDSMPNLLWRNQDGKRFEDVAFRVGVALSRDGIEQAGMGAVLGDYDGDLLLDLYVTNFAEDHHTLYRNGGSGFFDDVTKRSRLANPTFASLGWGCALEDFDDDGDVDLFAANGHVHPQVDQLDLGTGYRQLNQIFENAGGGAWREATKDAGDGFEVRRCSRGSAYADLDDDGDLDLVIQNLDDVPTVLRNDSPHENAWVKVRLVGTASPRDAVGATVVVRAGGREQIRQLAATAGFLSSSDPRLHFGLGAAERVEEIVVRWPSGLEQRFADLAARRLYTLEEGAAEAVIRER